VVCIVLRVSVVRGCSVGVCGFGGRWRWQGRA